MIFRKAKIEEQDFILQLYNHDRFKPYTAWDDTYPTIDNIKDESIKYSLNAEIVDYLHQIYPNEVDIIKTKDGSFEIETAKPIEEFRKQFIGKVLVDNGIDKAQAEEAVKTYQYSQKQCESFYPVQMEDAEQFMRAGYALKFMDKPDFSAVVKMSEVPDRVITGKVPNTDKVTKTHEKEHLILTKKSGTPRCCKEKLE